jgi:hypothetical protein
MFDRLNPILLFLGGVVLRYGGDLLKVLIQFGLQRLACQVTIADPNPIYSAICWELERTGKVYDFSELIYTSTPLVPPAIESPTLKTKLQPQSRWIGLGYKGAYIAIHRHDLKVTDLQNTQLITLVTMRSWQPQMLAWLTNLELNYNLEAPLTVRLIGGTISIVRTQTNRRRETLAIDAFTEHELFSDLVGAASLLAQPLPQQKENRFLKSSYLTAESCAKMFGCFFPNSELAEFVTNKLGTYQVAPAAWQNYLQCQDHAQQSVAHCNFAELQESKTL